MADRTEVQLRFVDAAARHMQNDAEHEDLLDAEHEAIKALREAGEGDNVELLAALTDEAIAQSGLGEDHPVVKHRREALQAMMREREAVANGMDPREAAFITALGGDPRKLNGGFPAPGGDDFEF